MGAGLGPVVQYPLYSKVNMDDVIRDEDRVLDPEAALDDETDLLADDILGDLGDGVADDEEAEEDES